MIYWDLRQAREHPALRRGEAPPGLLSAPEQVYLRRLAVPKRRQDWLLGRWAVKALCRAWFAWQGENVAATELTVAAAPDGAPYVVRAGVGPLPLTVSLSHRAGAALVALVPSPRAPLGVDLEKVEPRSPFLVQDFFTGAEADAVARAGDEDRDRIASEIWSLKEAALKALRVGLRADTRSVEAFARPLPSPGWTPVALSLAAEAGVPKASARAFVRSFEDALIASVTLLGPAGEAEPSDALSGWPALDADARQAA